MIKTALKYGARAAAKAKGRAATIARNPGAAFNSAKNYAANNKSLIGGVSGAAIGGYAIGSANKKDKLAERRTGY